MDKTKVLFRKFKEGDVIAIFPEQCGNESPYTCSSYQHVGQHGACDPQGLMRTTKPAKPSEYKDLMMELRRVGYKLQLIHRLQYRFIQIRKSQLD